MEIKDKILKALGLSEEVQLGYQAKLEDGTIIVSTAKTLEAGSDISVLTEDGSTILLPEGQYKTDEGMSFSVEKEGIVAELYKDEVEKETEGAPVEEEEEMAEDDGKEADVEDWAGMEKRIQNLEDAVADLKKSKDGGDDEVEEMATEEESTPKKIKTTEEIEFEYQTKIDELNEKVIELSKEPSDTPVDTNKFSTEKNDSTPDFRKMTKRERILYNITK